MLISRLMSFFPNQMELWIMNTDCGDDMMWGEQYSAFAVWLTADHKFHLLCEHKYSWSIILWKGKSRKKNCFYILGFTPLHKVPLIDPAVTFQFSRYEILVNSLVNVLDAIIIFSFNNLFSYMKIDSFNCEKYKFYQVP